MFNTLHSKLESAFKKLTGKGTIQPKDIEEVVKEVRLALLEADVNFKVVKDFCAKVSEKALGESVLKGLNPAQQIIKIVNEELTSVMGSEASELNLKAAPPVVILVVGLQGSGKTTTSAKLGLYLKKELKKNPLLVPADVYRPAAIEQLKTLGSKYGLSVFDSAATQTPVQIASESHAFCKRSAHDVMIVDTAGRLQIDEALMKELQTISEITDPAEILLIADAMTGQEAVNVATEFNRELALTGIILTKLDGDARGGAALSMRHATGKPIKFVGVGEKADALEVFHPERLASRILGMGDVLTLIEKAQKEFSEEEALKLQKKMKKDQFDLNDFLQQLKTMRKFGSISSIAGMIPGISKVANQINDDDAEKELKRIEAIILSMTNAERINQGILNGSRRKRIAKGSGTSVEEVNKLLKQFLEMKKMMTQLTKGGLGGMMKMLGKMGMQGMKGGFR
jgi:signal recognition particle subunit SRP54